MFAPTFEQSKSVLSKVTEAIPQLSFEPLSMSATVIDPNPAHPTELLHFVLCAFGATLSSTVTVAVACELLPLTSTTVKVTVFAPTLEQSKSVLSKVTEANTTIIIRAIVDVCYRNRP